MNKTRHGVYSPKTIIDSESNMNIQTDIENEWLASGFIIFGNTTYIVSVCVTDLVLNCFALVADLASQQDQLAEAASTPELRVLFESNAHDLRRWEGDPEFLASGRPIASISPPLAARARLGNLKVVPSNFNAFMEGLMERAVDAKRGATMTFVLMEPQTPPYGPSLFVTESHDFLVRCATSGVICEVVSTEEMARFHVRAMKHYQNSRRLRQTPKKHP